MIKVYYSRYGENGHELQIRGHANYNAGADIVCAGVSAIAYTLLGYLENHQEEIDEIEGPAASAGDLYVACTGGETIANGFEMAAIGLAQMAQKYPDNISIHISA